MSTFCTIWDSISTVFLKRTNYGLEGEDDDGSTLPVIEQRQNTPQEMEAAGYGRITQVCPNAAFNFPSDIEIDPSLVWISLEDRSPLAVQEDVKRLARLAHQRLAQGLPPRRLVSVQLYGDETDAWRHYLNATVDIDHNLLRLYVLRGRRDLASYDLRDVRHWEFNEE